MSSYPEKKKTSLIQKRRRTPVRSFVKGKRVGSGTFGGEDQLEVEKKRCVRRDKNKLCVGRGG